MFKHNVPCEAKDWIIFKVTQTVVNY